MKINVTKKEYAGLVEMVLIADWVIHAHEDERSDATKPYTDIRKKVLSYHKEMGMEDAFRQEPEDDEYYETAEYEVNSPHMAFIEEYEEHTFWDTLVSKLAQRDLAAQEELSTEEPPSQEERISKLLEIQEHYEDEFAEFGLDNVRVETKTRAH